jgi:hypothetical protein
MILKCAQSYLLRTTYNVSGPAPADEIMAGFEGDSIEGTAVEAPRTRVELPEAIAGLFARAEDLDPLSWRRNEVEARVFGGDGAVLLDEVRRVKLELEGWLEKHEPKDAVVVDEQPSEARVDDRVGPSGEHPASMDIDAEPGEVLEPDDADDPQPLPEPDKLGGIPPSEPDDEPDALAARYRDDLGFQQQVDVLVERRMDLEAARDDADRLEKADELNAELDVVEQELRKLGVPDGWVPPASGDQSTFDV